MRRTMIKRSLFFVGILTVGLVVFCGGVARAQVLGADCFDGSCGGSKGIPECPEDFREVVFVTYANNNANETRDCVTVVSCTNFNEEAVAINCRFYHGLNAIPAGGRTPRCSV